MTTITRNYSWATRRKNLVYRSFNIFVKAVFSVLCKVDTREIKQVPMQGPLILVSNHINFLEVPVLFSFFQPRPMTALVKSENWNHPFFRNLFTLWGGIPIRRGEADLDAFQSAQEALEKDMILAISPEGTRTQGKLIKGHPGIVLLAVRSGAPILPVAHWGGENFWDNLHKFRRTDFHIHVGKPFHITAKRKELTREVREIATDEIMYQLATLLPMQYRGEYSDLSKATTQFIQYPNGAER